MSDEPQIVKFRRTRKTLPQTFAEIWQRIGQNKEPSPVDNTQPTTEPPAATDTLDALLADPVAMELYLKKMQLLAETMRSQTEKASHDLAKTMLMAAEERRQMNQREHEEILLRLRTLNRPSIVLEPPLTYEQGRWVASWGALRSVGDTPDQAYDNFDHEWVNG